jgi:hypothetical protein
MAIVTVADIQWKPKVGESKKVGGSRVGFYE